MLSADAFYWTAVPASMMIWNNPDMVSNIRETNKMLNLSTNAGVLSTNKKAYLPRESQ
jgi:hypothetical protein